MICPRCKSATNPEGTKYCLECGALLPAAPPPSTTPATQAPQAPLTYAPRPRQMVQQPAETTSGMAIASLVLGITSPCCVTGILGLILGIVALTQINRPRSGLKGSGLAYTGIALSICLPLLLMAVVYPIYSKARNIARTGVDAGMCSNNIRMLAIATLAYAQDHDETLPNGDTLWALPSASPAIAYCPTKGKGVIGYGYYQNVAGKPLGSIGAPNTTPLLADGGDANHMITSDADIDHRHLGGYNQAYVDAHIETLGLSQTPVPMPSGSMP